MFTATQKQQIVQELIQKGVLITPELLDILTKKQLFLDDFGFLEEKMLFVDKIMKKEVLAVLEKYIRASSQEPSQQPPTQPLLKDKKEQPPQQPQEATPSSLQNAFSSSPLPPTSPSPNHDETLLKKQYTQTTHQPPQHPSYQTYQARQSTSTASVIASPSPAQLPPLEVLFNYTKEQGKKDIMNFVNFFNDRYQRIKRMLQQRAELEGITTIKNVLRKRDREQISIIGMVKEINETKNGNLMIDIEDPTGTIRAIVSKAKPEVFALAKSLVHDEVIGLQGFNGDNVLFVNNLVLPDIPATRELAKATKEQYALFIGDVHIGSKNFMKASFDKLMQWIQGKYGNEKQRNLAKKINYIFFMGDNVDGVGVYPNQLNDLTIPDIYEQYKLFEEYVLSLPKNKQIIIIPGNHDASRISEPQPPLANQFLSRLVDQPHIHLLSSPSYVRIGHDEKNKGYVVLLYHGYSYPWYAENLPEVREAGGLERVDLLMKALLQKRHLAPAHTSTLYIPDDRDNLVIDPLPDIFASGHIHRTTLATYRSVILINASCWMEETEYQKKVGLKPQPAKAILVGLHNREAKIISFGS